MTRFARAKGSKSSNERLPEEATSWSEMKQQLAAQKQAIVDKKNQAEANNKRRQNYNKFLEEQEQEKSKTNEWAEFPNLVSTINKASKQAKKGTKRKLNETADKTQSTVKHAKPLDTLAKVEQEENATKLVAGQKPKKKKKQVTDNPETASTKKVTPTVKQKSLDQMTPEEQEKHAKKLARRQRQKENKKQFTCPDKSTKDVNKTPVAVPKKKPFEELTEEEQKKVTKKKEKKVRQLEKKLESTKNFKAMKEPKRRKPMENVQRLQINGKDMELVYFDGFQIKKEDAERLQELRKQMIAKGLPRSEIQAALKLERRRAEKALSREKKSVCFKCRKAGHTLAECPEIDAEGDLDTAASGICFKCGSTEHRHFECKVVRDQEYRFAKCFICKEQGHISNQCPENPRGLYPKGGACKMCGDVTHLKKDCPKYVAEQEANAMSLDTLSAHTNPDAMQDSSSKGREIKPLNSVSKVNKIIKF